MEDFTFGLRFSTNAEQSKRPVTTRPAMRQQSNSESTGLHSESGSLIGSTRAVLRLHICPIDCEDVRKIVEI